MGGKELRKLADTAWDRGNKELADDLHEAARQAEAEEAYEPDDPKHPTFHERSSDLWDMRRDK